MNAKVILNHIFRRKQMKALDEELKVRIDIADNQAVVSANHPALAALAKFLTEYYEEVSANGGFVNGANYVGVDVVDHANQKGYHITIHRWGRPEPAQIAANFRKALESIIANPQNAAEISTTTLHSNGYPLPAKVARLLDSDWLALMHEIAKLSDAMGLDDGDWADADDDTLHEQFDPWTVLREAISRLKGGEGDVEQNE